MYSIESFINYVYEDEYDYATEGIIGDMWEGVKKFLRKVKDFFIVSIPNFFKRLFGKNPELKKDPEVQKAVKEIDKTQKESIKIVKETENDVKKAETTKDNETKEETKQEVKSNTDKLKENINETQEGIKIVNNARKRHITSKQKKDKSDHDNKQRKNNGIYSKTSPANIHYKYRKKSSGPRTGSNARGRFKPGNKW